MKKTALFLTVLALCFSLCGCGSIENILNADIPPIPTYPNGKSEEALATETDEVTVAPEDIPEYDVTVCFTPHRLDVFDPETGTVQILSFRYDSAEVKIENAPDVEEKINGFLSELDVKYIPNENGTGTEIDLQNYAQSLAEDRFTAISDSVTEVADYLCSYSRTASAYASENILTITYTTTSDIDELFDEGSTETYLFSLDTGELLENVFADTGYAGTGVFHVDNADSFAVEGLPVKDSCVASEEGDDFYLIAEGIIYDLTISEAVYDEENMVYNPGTELCYYNYVMNEAVHLQYYVPEGYAEIMISMVTDGRQSAYVILMAEDGAIMLMPAENPYSLG